ncbi:MAG: hypothetical protein IT260_15300 [Saprospiraceae bacterium]|nr:hypothetical protein [Saprospiraceae bacterium]
MKIPVQLVWPAWAFFLLLAGGSALLHFNGLYGQDAYEYLRQSQVIVDRWAGMPLPVGHTGDVEIAGGYPLAGALLRWLGVPGVLALQLVSWMAAAAAVWLFGLILQVLSPGARQESRWVFGVVSLALAPAFVRAGFTVMSDALGVALALGALFFAFRLIELERWRAAPAFVLLAALAVTTRYALVVLLLLPALAVALELWRARQWRWLAAALAAGLSVLWLLWWLKSGAPKSPLTHSLLQDWSLWNLFQRCFTQASGSVCYTLPNLAYLFFPLMHPAFCLTLPALFLLAKRTDAVLYSKRLLLLSLGVYLLFIGGLSHQNLRYLLPAYALLLLLFFPAWDRFFAYGFYFFKRLAYALIGLTVVGQVFFSIYFLKPVLARHQLENEVAASLARRLPPEAIVYAMDLDIALQHYLPEVEWRSIWARSYDTFPSGSFILFNEAKLTKQWAGQNPMLNWEHARQHFVLQDVLELPEGWTLYRVDKPK